jgi:hypothetical protein
MDNRSLSCAPKTYRKPVYASPPLRRLPYVLVLLRCDACKRADQARAVGEVRAEILLDDLLVRLSADCPWRDDPRGTCGARFSDMPPQRPPDWPGALMRFRVVNAGKS